MQSQKWRTCVLDCKMNSCRSILHIVAISGMMCIPVLKIYPGLECDINGGYMIPLQLRLSRAKCDLQSEGRIIMAPGINITGRVLAICVLQSQSSVGPYLL